MRLHYIQHVWYENPAFIFEWAGQNNIVVTGTCLNDGQDLPLDIGFDILLILGGPMSVNDTSLFPWLCREKKYIENAIGAGKKVLGICLGAQLIAEVLGAKVYKNKYKEIGWFDAAFTSKAKNINIFNGFPKTFKVFQWHGDTFELPEGSIRVASGGACENQAFIFADNVAALQFHLEMNEESIVNLIINNAAQFSEDRYVQTPKEIISASNLIKKANFLMSNIMNKFCFSNEDFLDEKLKLRYVN